MSNAETRKGRKPPVAKCECPIYCKYCGARRKRDHVGHYCGTRNCQWEYGFKGCTAKTRFVKALELSDEQRKLIGDWWNTIGFSADNAAEKRSREFQQKQWPAIEAIAFALFKYLPSLEAALAIASPAARRTHAE